MIETCERCGTQSAKLERCEYCGRKLCLSCIKSSVKKKVGHLHICKDCWGNMEKRALFKSYTKKE
ncbi:MAG: hypothetical protein QW590_01405 [Candidatus Bilamarchaeaceae archaeon]